MKAGLVCGMLFSMAPASAQVNPASAAQSLESDPRVARARGWLRNNAELITQEQIRITQIPAPSFHEQSRGAHLRKLLAAAGLRVRTDSVGNIIGEKAGTGPGAREIVMVVAHLDTVFPAGTDVTVRQQNKRLLGPGITDNGTGLATLVALARAMQDARIKPRRTVLLVADVGEEGEGNLRGMRKLVETYRDRLKYVIAVDGSAPDSVVTAALASRRYEVTVSGPGGHSWSDFGEPNPINAAARGIAGFARLQVPENPRTTYNVGEISGGTSVNSIPYKASFKVDMRSESQTEIGRMEAALREAVQAGLDEELSTAKSRRSNGKLETKFRLLGERPGGELPADSPLLAAVREADRILGNGVSRTERSSTDANIPLSLGIHAISIGGGGRGGGAHSLEEWYDPTGRELGLQRALLILLGVAGVTP